MEPPFRTKPLSPSKLAVAEACALRYLLETEASAFLKLPISLPSMVGRAIHAAIDAVAKGYIPHDIEALRSHVFTNLLALAGAERSILAVFDALQAPLSIESLIAPSRLASAVHTAFAQSRVYGAVSRNVKLASKNNVGIDRLNSTVFGTEVELKSESYDLRGFSDRIERLGDGTIEVTDFKSGAARDEQGALLKSYRLQVGAYALLVRERHPDSKIGIKVSASDGDWLEIFDQRFESEIVSEVTKLAAKIPRGVSDSPAKLAQPGAVCSRCRYRPSCPAYKAWAPTQWSATTETLPLDAFGEVEAVDRRTDRLVDLRLASLRRHVRILAVPETLLLETPATGECLELYNIASSEPGSRGKFPRNFYVANIVRPLSSAFSAFGITTRV